MEFRILGPLEFRDGDDRISIGGQKQRAVLAILVLHLNQVVSTDVLIDGVWGAAPPENARNSVQVYVSRLRKAITNLRSTGGSTGALLRRGAGYVLEADPSIIDVNQFSELVRQGVDRLSTSPQTASDLLGQALALWRGTALGEFTTEPFAQVEGPRLEEERLKAVGARVEAELALGHHRELVADLDALVSDHPFHEVLIEQLVLSLYRSGRQAEALAVVRRARRTFAEELGIEPGRSLQNLEAAILSHDAALDWIAPTTARLGEVSDASSAERASGAPWSRTGAHPVAWNVPPRNPHFTGRAAILDDIHTRLVSAGDTVAVQSIYGLGGVGKTQLAIEYAHRFVGGYSIVWWIDAQQPVLIPGQLIALAQKLGLPTDGAPEDVVDSLLARLADAPPWLLIWDNAESAEHIAGYRPSGRGHVLVTSRSPDWGALGGRIEVLILDRTETIAFLRTRIHDLTDDVASDLAEELGDLPLAAAQAAGYLEQTGLDPAGYLRQFRRRRSALLARGNVLGYQGRVDTAWQLSLERLGSANPAAVALLETVAFFGPEPIPASLFTNRPDLLEASMGAAILAEPDALEDAIGAGVGYSLIRRDHDCLLQHRLVQAVIRDQLPDRRRRTIGATVVRLLAGNNPGDPNDPATWPEFARLAPHVLATGPLGDEDPEGRQLILATVAYLNVRGDTLKARRIAEQLLERWRQVLGEDHPDTLTCAANLTAALAWVAEHDKARELGRDTLRRSRVVLGSDHPVTLRLATHLTFALAWLGESEEACRIGEENLGRSRNVLGPDSSDTLRLAANLAFALAANGQPGRGRDLARQTLDRARAALGPDNPVTLVAAAHLALALGWLGEAQEGRELNEDTLIRARRALGPNHPTTLAAAAQIAFILIGQGEPEEARSLSADAFERARKALGPEHLITLISAAVLSWALAELDEAEAARIIGEETLTLARGQLGGDNLVTLIAAGALADALAKLGDAHQARLLVEESVKQSTERLGPEHLITRTLTDAMATLIRDPTT
jgi:DNA-binding SARP family transcriptional activator